MERYSQAFESWWASQENVLWSQETRNFSEKKKEVAWASWQACAEYQEKRFGQF